MKRTISAIMMIMILILTACSQGTTGKDTPQKDTSQNETVQNAASESNTSLSEASPSDVSQSDASLSEASPSDVSQSDASLSETSRSDVSQSDASMSEASLSAASQSDASLSEASQSDASLSEASQSDASLSTENAQIANPWSSITEEEVKELYPKSFKVPEGAENAAWSVMNASDFPEMPGALVQLDFDLDGNHFTAREQQTYDREYDLSGMYYTWTAEDTSTLKDGNGQTIPCQTYRYFGDEETADLCTWYDEESGISYSISVTAEDLDGFDIQAVAEALIRPAE